MTAENPYAAPRTANSPDPRPGLGTLFGSVGAVFATSLLGGLLGLLIGAALGAFVPSYYRSVIAGGSQPGFDPVAVGVGLGLTQGMLFGAAIGVALVALYYWHQRRMADKPGDRAKH